MAKNIEDKYKVLDPISHILLRPNTYVGSNKPNTADRYVIVDNKIKVEPNITIVPSFLKIFDEVISNSVDESKREGSKLNTIKVSITDNRITVWDNGGIPIVIHTDHNMYVPEVIFGNLLSGSNYNDDEERLGAGTNGLGSKLCNVFSSEFKITSCDGKKVFEQTFSNNMRERTEPVVNRSTKNHTEISYLPDYEKFGLTGLDEHHYKMIQKRIYDIAGTNSNLKVYFNDQQIIFKSFADYIKMYEDDVIFETDGKWSLGISKSQDGGFKQVSFVNTVETYDGGTHVDYVTTQIINKLREFFKKKHKVDIKPSEIKNHLFIFLNSSVINSSFSAQTKEKLITEPKDFGHLFNITDKFIKRIIESEIIQSILDWIDRKKQAEENKLARDLNKSLSKVKVDKLIDAKGKDRWKCSLGLFEGDCLHEDTLIRVLRDGEMIDSRMKDLNIDDMVITHNNTYSNISALTKKINKKVSIITKSEGEIVCGKNHRWFVYDISTNEFYFIETHSIDKNKHKLVKNYLCFMEALLEISEHSNDVLIMKSGEVIDTNDDHKFAVYDREENIFQMIENKYINKDRHFIVNTFKI